ncbi:hypothetical protein GPROT2_00675 [Gammaproteobacteria bacterium]|nr:hypothetical protein [Gammaproteobacteria bacterium]QOJ32471.1 MAG: hypothetical protein HRU81_10340 [Gammaproteobacteria bacterium]CAG0939656.1 hypothetical protein GPROT2_00675 [Gammaproteobacteria bacterium]
MNPIRSHPKHRRGAPMVAALALVLPVLAGADDRAPATVITTARPAPAEPQPAGTVRFDAYRNFDGRTPADGPARPADSGPGHGGHDHDGTAMEIGVAVDLARCADGNTEVSAIDAGGWQHKVEDVCANASAPAAGAVTLHQEAGPAPAAAAPAAPAAPATPAEARPVMRCDPATWRCSPAPQ